jgi:hypothetical protein
MNKIPYFAQILDPNEAGLPQTPANQDTLDTIMTQIYIAIGAIGLILIMIAGLRYITSQGDPSKITQAKNMVLYTLIGVIIAALAASIVTFVLQA